MRSLRLRLLAWTSLLLAASFALLGAVIDSGFKAALAQAQRDLLDSQIITLLAVAEPGDGDTLELPFDMPEARLNSPGSGLYASIRDADGNALWRSASAVGLDLEPAPPLRCLLQSQRLRKDDPGLLPRKRHRGHTRQDRPLPPDP